jgi:hypothetical protein
MFLGRATVLRELLFVTIGITALGVSFSASAQDDPPPLDPEDIVIPDLPYEEPGGEPAAAVEEPVGDDAGFEAENTPERCSDQLDNDEDGYVDCEDQDCEIFAICVKRPAAAPQAKPEPAAAAPEPEPEPEPVAVPRGYKRAESSKMRVLKIMGHATLWPGLGIVVITTALHFSDDSETCQEDDSDFLGVCSGYGWAVGGALAVTGAILLSIYYVKRKRIVENNPDLALNVSPLVGDGFYGVGGVLLF